MATPSRLVVMSYGSWDSNDTGFHLDGVHEISMDERTFRLSFDVVVTGASAGACETLAATMVDQLNQRHLDTKVVINGTKWYHFVDGADGAVSSDEEGAEFIMASHQLLGTHRTDRSRAYRVSIEVTRGAKQTGKLGVYEQDIRLRTAPNGLRSLSFKAQFTPGTSSATQGTAEQRFADGTYGFEALVTAITTALTGEWEQASTLTKHYEEDSRTLTASTSYHELIFDQSSGLRNNTSLFNVRYGIKVDNKAAFGIPGHTNVQPLTPVTVTFSCAVVTTTTDLDTVINSVIIPHIKSNVGFVLQSGPGGSGPLVLLANGLKADPVSNRIAGECLFLVEETKLLEVSKRTSDNYTKGDNYIPVLDGTEFTRDKHTGPGKWVRRVAHGLRTIGVNASALEELSRQEIIRQAKDGFVFRGYGEQISPTVEVFREHSSQITTTVAAQELIFTKANVRYSTGPGTGGGAGRTRSRGVSGAALSAKLETLAGKVLR